MPQEGGIRGYYYQLSDRAWLFAEWLEAKGLPIASVCDKYKLNPVLLFAIIALAIILLIALAMGSFSSVSYGELTVKVTSDGHAVEGALVKFTYGGEPAQAITDAAGLATLSAPVGPEFTLSVSKENYASAMTAVMLSSDNATREVKLQRKTGDLTVRINSGSDITGASVVVENWAERIDLEKPLSGDSVVFSDIPTGIKLNTYLKLGSQRIPSAGISATVLEGGDNEVTIPVASDALSISFDVHVKDTAYQNVNDATVTLYDWNTQMPIGAPQRTSGGYVSFEAPVGSSVYLTVDPNTGLHESYNGRSRSERLEISRDGLTFDVVLAMVGRVRVCVYDEGGNPLNTGSAILYGIDSQSYASELINDECVDFYGIPEGVTIYPKVNANGYVGYSGRQDAMTVDYSSSMSFNVDMRRQSSSDTVNVYVSVQDCDGNPVNGIEVMIVDAAFPPEILDNARTTCAGSATLSYQGCGSSASSVASGREIYAVAFDDDYQVGSSASIYAEEGSVLSITTCRADDTNSGDLRVCVYRDGAPASEADVELYDVTGTFMWMGTTGDQEEEEENCYVFRNIPDSTSVYARALNFGASPATSDSITIAGGETKELVVYSGTAPVILEQGDVEICVRDSDSGLNLVADVTLYDYVTGNEIIAGRTAGAGCRLFSDLDAESNEGGQIVPREVYIVADSDGYGTYDGAAEGDILEMLPGGRISAEVLLSEAYEVCTQVRASDTDEPLDAKVVMYYNKTGTPVSQARTDSDGVARFYQKRLDTYYFRVQEDLSLYEPAEVYEFEREDLVEGECGVIELYDLGTLCDLGVNVLEGGETIRSVDTEDVQIPFRITKGGVRADMSIAGEGTFANLQEVYLDDESRANVTFRLDGQFKQFSLSYGATEFSPEPEMIATLDAGDVGTYNAIIEVATNPMCVRQGNFELEIYEEQLLITADEIYFNPYTQKSTSFCIYVKDQDGDEIKDAAVNLRVDEEDGWADSAVKSTAYDEFRGCYRGTLTESMAENMEVGAYPLYAVVKRAGVTKTAELSANIGPRACGNSVLDSDEECDPTAAEQTCESGLLCSPDTCSCIEYSSDLSVTAESVEISIGSGASSGFCVQVYEKDGSKNEGAKVTAGFYASDGWPQDTTKQVTYDTARGCYYITVSQNMVWPTAGYNMGSVQKLLASKTVSISAVDGNRIASTTTSATLTCACDLESYYEANCPCDDDTPNSGNLDLFGCLQLASAQGYYPTAPSGQSYYNSQTAYQSHISGRGYSSTSGGGSTTISRGTIGTMGPAGGIAVNWEQCKSLFSGLGWGGTSVSAQDAILVNDDCDVLKEDSGCANFEAAIKDGSRAPTYFVDYNTGTDDCCNIKTDNRCDRTKFNQVYDSATRDGRALRIDIRELTQTVLNTYGLDDDYRIVEGQNGKILYDIRNRKLYSKGAVLSKVVRNPDSRSIPKGTILIGFLWDCDDDCYKTCLAEKIGRIVNFEGIQSAFEGVTYLDCGCDGEGEIIVGSNPCIDDVLKGVWITPQQLAQAIQSGRVRSSTIINFNKDMLSEGTTMTLVTDYASISQTTTAPVLKQIYEALDRLYGSSSRYPYFGEIGDIKYCEGGDVKELNSKKLVLHLAVGVYAVSEDSVGPEGTCKLADGKLSNSNRDFNAHHLGYVIESSDSKIRAYVAGKDDFICRLLQLAETKRRALAPNRPVVALGKNFAILTSCMQDLPHIDCGGVSTQAQISAQQTAIYYKVINSLTGLEKVFEDSTEGVVAEVKPIQRMTNAILTCACVGTAPEPEKTGTISGKIKMNAGCAGTTLCDPSIQKVELKYKVKFANGDEVSITKILKDAGSWGRGITCTSNSIDYEIDYPVGTIISEMKVTASGANGLVGEATQAGPYTIKEGDQKVDFTLTCTTDKSATPTLPTDCPCKEYYDFIKAAAAETDFSAKFLLALIMHESDDCTKFVGSDQLSYGLTQINTGTGSGTGFSNTGWCGQSKGPASAPNKWTLPADRTACQNELKENHELAIHFGAWVLREYYDSCEATLTCSGTEYSKGACATMAYNCGPSKPCGCVSHYNAVEAKHKRVMECFPADVQLPTTAKATGTQSAATAAASGKIECTVGQMLLTTDVTHMHGPVYSWFLELTCSQGGTTFDDVEELRTLLNIRDVTTPTQVNVNPSPNEFTLDCSSGGDCLIIATFKADAKNLPRNQEIQHSLLLTSKDLTRLSLGSAAVARELFFSVSEGSGVLEIDYQGNTPQVQASAASDLIVCKELANSGPILYAESNGKIWTATRSDKKVYGIGAKLTCEGGSGDDLLAAIKPHVDISMPGIPAGESIVSTGVRKSSSDYYFDLFLEYSKPASGSSGNPPTDKPIDYFVKLKSNDVTKLIFEGFDKSRVSELILGPKRYTVSAATYAVTGT